MNSSGKLSVSIYSDANILALNIFDSLIAKDCFVNVITNDYNNWKIETVGATQKNKLGNLSQSNYAIFLGGFTNPKNAYDEFIKFSSLLNLQRIKSIAIFPFEIFDKEKIDSIKINDNLAIIFVGDLLGPQINLNNDTLISRTISEIIRKRQMSIGIGEFFYPLYITDITKLINKWMFSFGPYGKITLVLGKPTSVDVFWNENQKLIGKIKLIYNPKILPRNTPKGVNIEKINSDLTLALTETYKWLGSQQKEMPLKVKKIKSFKETKIKIPKAVKPAIILLIILFVFPFVMLLVNLLISLVAYREFLGTSDENAKNTILFAKSLAVIAENESKMLGYIPGINLIYKEVSFTAGLVGRIDEASFHAIPIIRNGEELFGNVLGSNVYDPGGSASKIASSLFLLNNDLTSMKRLSDDASNKNVLLANKILSKFDFDKYINITLQGQVLAGNLPGILGEDKIKTYLVLFQNNMEIRPTGGFIGSYGLMTFDGGRLTDLSVNDIYSADGQLYGHVEPPAPIKNYLGEANWWFRDSNWDPDFPTSAQRAEWFLNKEVGKNVDGVLAIDLFPIKDILNATGPIYLPDFNLNITSANLYEKTQSESQDNSFPGTHQKASFLTALSRSLLGGLGKLNVNQKLAIIKIFYNSLDSRHLQIFLHDASSQSAVSSIGWDGSVTLSACGNGCYADIVGLVEANVGVNKANYFIDRNVKLNVKVGSYQIERTLTLSLKDNANSALGPAGRYKAYIRLIVPHDAEILDVSQLSGQTKTPISPDITEVKDRKEVGIPVEILGGQSGDLVFSWKSNITTAPINGYSLYIRKQAGIELLPISLSVSTPSLTAGTPYLYNAILTRDLFTRFSF